MSELKPWQTKGPDGKVYGLQPVSDWADWALDADDDGSDYVLTDEQKKRVAAALGTRGKPDAKAAKTPVAADKVKAAKPSDRKT